MQIFGSIGWLLGFILWGAFYIFKNFGIAIIVQGCQKNKRSCAKNTATTAKSSRRK